MSRLHRLLQSALFGACLFTTAAFAEPGRDLPQEQANTRLVLDFYEKFFNQHHTDDAVRVVSDSYKQHNPTVPDGKAPFVKFFSEFYKTHPDARSTVIHTAAQGDLVYMHIHSQPDPSSPGTAILNIFRVEHGLITEHWDIIQPIPAPSANQNGMFGITEASDTKPRDLTVEASNRKLVLDFYDQVFNKHQVAEASRVLSEGYIQHNPGVANGKTPFVNYFNGYFKNHPQSKVKVVRSVAQDDLVWLHVHSRGSAHDRGQAVLEVFRVKDGRIVEHWDVIQAVPEKSMNANGMF